MHAIDLIAKETAALRKALKEHALYQELTDIDDVSLFMEKHVYAVWDFMSLLKALQQELTCLSLPWKPAANPKTARFINEIVLGEETDINEKGEPKSHFEMYIDAMNEVNANTTTVLSFIDQLGSLEQIDEQLKQANLKAAEYAFLKFTFDTIASKKLHKIASAFTFGREELIPDMFIEIINQAQTDGVKCFPKLTYYLERHIELDGDEHGPLSLAMIQELCGEDEVKWQEARETAVLALEKRLELWDEMAAEIKEKNESLSLV